MKLKKLHIYGFGRFQDYQIDLLNEPIHVFLGENEAGKSTIMAFISAILFGFPKRQQNELRFEPKLGGTYGGKIELETLQYGHVSIERKAGKATGNVVVYFSDGTVGGEIELKQLLGGMDRTIFKSIYSFGLVDLQNLEQLNSEELNKFMYGVGMGGRHNLAELERKTEKTLHSLYKPNGRIPVINTKLKDLMGIEEDVNSWKKKLSVHETMVKEQKEIHESLRELDKEKQQLHETLLYYQKLQSLKTSILKQKMLEEHLEQLPSTDPFPEAGVERLDKLVETCDGLRAELGTITKKLKEIEVERELLACHSDLPKLIAEVTEAKETSKVCESKQEERALLIQSLHSEKQEYEALVEKLGKIDRNIDDIETSLIAEQNLSELVEQEEKSKQTKELLKTQFEQTQLLMEEKEKQVAILEGKLLDQNTRKKLEERQEANKTKRERQNQLPYVDQSLQLVDSQLKQTTGANLIRNSMFGLLLFLMLSSGIYLVVEKDFLVLFAILIVVIPIVLLFMKMVQTSKAIVKDLRLKKNDLLVERQSILQQFDEKDFQEESDSLIKDNQIQEQLLAKRLQLEEGKEHYQLLSDRKNNWQQDSNRIAQEISNWAIQFGYPVGFQARQYLKLFSIVEEVKKKKRQISRLEDRILAIDRFIETNELLIEKLFEKYLNSNDNESFIQKMHHLSQLVVKEQDKEKQYLNLLEQEKIIESQQQAIGEKITYYYKEIEQLFKVASVSNEEQFRRKAKAKLESEKVHEQIQNHEGQIAPLIKNEEERRRVEKDVLRLHEILDLELERLDEEISNCLTKKNALLKQSAEITHKIKELEEGSSYSQQLHNFEKEKGILKTEVKKWLFHRTVKLVIDEAKLTYEKDRQPRVIKEATKLFSFMTNNQYTRLFAPIGEQRFIVERNDCFRFEPNELSQGTQEQLYLALRLALAFVHSKENYFPIFIDDIFVNFDEKRRLRAMELLKKVAEKHQIIFFTCHPFMANELYPSHYKL